MWERYVAHPLHLYIYCLPLLVTGTAVFAWGWEVPGITIFCVGVAAGIWISVAGIVEERVRDRDSQADMVKTLHENKDPDVWAAMGYVLPDQHPQILLQKASEHAASQPVYPTADTAEKHKPMFPTLQLFPLPVSLPTMRVFSDGILTGSPLSDTYWTKDRNLMPITKLRELKRLMRKHGLIAYKEGGSTQGFMITASGLLFLLGYASRVVQLEYERNPERVQQASPTLPELVE